MPDASRAHKRVGLALGGGAARGLAHIGVLEALQEANIPIDYVAGTSAGAIIGAAFCAGLGLEKIKQIALQVRWHHIIRPVWPAQGLVTLARLEQFMVKIMGDVNFDDLQIPFAAVATDLEKGQAVVLREGRVAPAVRASCCVPGFVTPVRLNGRLLGDGCATDNLPAAALRQMGAEYIIGVYIMPPVIRRRWGALGYAMNAIEILVQQAGRGIELVDCLIAPDLADLTYVRFSQGPEMIARGYQAAREKLPIIQRDICWS